MLRTYTGKEVNPLQLDVKDICIEDIAHALSLCNRFAGHTRFPISVAQHSVYVSKLCDHNLTAAMQGLLHDASEAYIGDMTKWVKHTLAMAAFRELEGVIQAKIFNKFNCPIEITANVEWADRVMVRFEGKKGFKDEFVINHPDYPPLTQNEIRRIGKWERWDWKKARSEFLRRYETLNAAVIGSLGFARSNRTVTGKGKV